MIVRQTIAAAVLAAVAALALLSALGMLRSKNNLAALHCLGITSVSLPFLTVTAVLVSVGFGVSAIKTLCFAVILLVGAPVCSHAIAVAEHRRKPQ